MKKKQWLIAAVVVSCVGTAAGLACPLLSPGVYTGVRIEGVEVGGKNREEIIQLLSLWRSEYRSRHLVVYYGDIISGVDAAAIDYDLDVEATADEACNYGRRGAWSDRLGSIRIAARDGYRLAAHFTYSEAKLDALLEQWRAAIDRPPRNAALSLVNRGIVPQKLGRRLDVEALRPLLLQALHNQTVERLPLPVTPLYPEITVADLEQSGLKVFRATYATAFDSSDSNRSANIRQAAHLINGYILYPGQIFSFNQVVGPRDTAHGFKEALEIVDGEFVPGIGGGVCQLSSTLYNAVLLANLAIVERYNHSKPLGYVELGRDATVAYDSLDFRFANDTAGPIMILAETQLSRLLVGIVGQHPATVTVEIVTAERLVIPPAVVKIQDPRLSAGETRLDKQGKPGYEVTTFRVVRSSGRELKRELLAKDRYLPENTVVKIGGDPPGPDIRP